jgi:subtilisin family serine protease
MASATDSSWSNAPWPTTRFIVRNSGGVAAINTVCQLLGCNVVEGIGDPDGLVFLVQDVGLLPPPAFLNKLLSAAGVVDAEPDQTVLTLAASVQQIPGYLTDRAPITYYGANVWEGYVLQTPNQIVRSSQTQTDFGVTGSGVTVAVIDTGVDPNNAILQSVLLPGYDFTRNNNGGSEMGDISQSTAGVIDGNIAQLSQSTAGVIDQSTAGVIDTQQYAAFGHGTMTAGIVHLVAPQANILPLKAFNAHGTARASDILRAIYYAARNGAKVINMSFEFSSPSPELGSAVNNATSQGVICVASAGNDGKMEMVYPASLPNVIDVASTGNTNTPSSFSNYGAPPVSISAPGEAVMTTYPFNTYAVGWGTSFSAPFVSGTVALMAGVNQQLTNSAAANALANTQPFSSPNSQYGSGVLDTHQAVQAWASSLSSN